MNTNSVVIEEWSDDPAEGRSEWDWPYPTKYQVCLITGELADKVRERLDLDDSVPVHIKEEVVSGGWSEYTQENDYYHTLEVGGQEITLRGDDYGNGLNSLLEWLDSDEG